MARLKKVVHFLQIAEKDENDHHRFFANTSFWPDLWQHLEGLAQEDSNRLDVTFRDLAYSGNARRAISPAVDFFYIGKKRNVADFPDVDRGLDNRNPLDLAEIPNNPKGLLEPAYLRPIPRTNVVAVLRSSGAASWSAIEHWLNQTSGWFEKQSTQLALVPVTRTDILERVANALGAARLHLQVAPTPDGPPEGAGKIGAAISAAQEASAHDVYVDMQFSYRNAKPDENTAQEFLNSLRALLRWPSLTKLEGTLMSEDEDTQNLKKEAIDFMKDRVSFATKIDGSPDTPPTQAAILHGLGEAIDEFGVKIGDNYAK